MRHLGEGIEFEVLKPRQDATAVVHPKRRLLFLRRQKWVVLFCTILMGAVGIGYVLQREPAYTAHGLLLVENTQLDPGRQELVPSMGIVDTSMVDSQIEIIKSDAIALKVIKALNLAEGESQSGRPDWWAMVKNFFPPAAEENTPDGYSSQRVAMHALQQGLSVKRIGNTYAIDIQFTARNPATAAHIINEIINAYLTDQAAANAAAASSASAWLRDRIKDLGPKTRIISSADPPLRPDGPGRLKLFGTFVALGFLSGLGFAVTREVLDTTLRDPVEVETRLRCGFIGAVTKFSRRTKTKPFKTWKGSPRGDHQQVNTSLEFPASSNEALMLPHLDLANAVARARALVARAGVPSVIGVTSSTSGQGVTTISFNLAISAAAAGDRVLLVDGNGYHRDLSQKRGSNSGKGLGDATTEKVVLQAVMRRHKDLELYFVPWAGRGLADQCEGRRAELAALVESWKAEFDLVIIDLPPLLPAPDVAFARPSVDSLLLVIEWGSVPAELMSAALSASDIDSSDLIGFIFNKVPSSAIRQSTFPVEAYLRRYWRRNATGSKSAQGARLEFEAFNQDVSCRSQS